MELGEVRCTKNFLGKRTVNRVKVSVGVSVSSGLLELDIATEDVPAAELLDILKSYRTKKKYYRLKNGSFVDLEEPSLEMLAELSEAMNLKDKEVLKGKLKLPMYRTLYLDKLLEENESVYSSRDSRFREVVKEFKTVKDADFEEPKSLSRVMRKYQKDGYKWLRTLETWQFGGILADDMGLGKTIQVIAVLLAAKEEGRPLLTVCSACHNVIKQTNHAMKTDSDFAFKVNNYLSQDKEKREPYGGETEVYHYLEFLRDKIGFDKIKEAVKNPLKGKKIAAYYGCLLLRPNSVMKTDDAENPKIMEDFIKALGAEPVIYSQRNECCGGYIALEDPEQAKKRSNAVSSNAASCGAELMVTACPLCKYNLVKNGSEIPVIYFTELLAEALGIKEDGYAE